MKKIFKLGYIHCAGCSVALQDKICKVENVKSAQINFVTKLVTVDIEYKNSKETMRKIEEAIHDFDKTIEILPADAEEKQKLSQKIEYILLAISAVLWLVGIVLQYTVTNIFAYLPLYLVSYAMIAYKVLWQAIKNVFKGKVLDETFLMSIATICAFVIGEYLEGCAVMIFYCVGEIFQHLATKKSENRIKSLAGLQSTTANKLLDDGSIEVVDIINIKVGDKICVNAGEKVPLDGKIVNGGAHFNTAAITGESVGEYLTVNQEILSGYISEDGTVTIEVSCDASSSTVSKIVQMVQEASASKANTEKFIAKFAKYYTPIVVLLAAIVCFIPPIFDGYTLLSLKTWVYRGLSFLVISCPCALVLSVPLTFFAGIGAAAKSGVLVKGSNYLELLAKTKVVCFDKTGTLTTGQFQVTNVVSLGEKEKEEILETIAYAESFSNHRIAKSIYQHYVSSTGKTINTAWVNGYNEIAGGGIVANIFMQDCLVGNAKFLQTNGIEFDAVETHETVVYLAVSGKVEGYLCLSDTVKEDSKQTVSDLKGFGIESVMLTGDKNTVAKQFANNLGIDRFYAELLPAQKVQKLKAIKNNSVVTFVGDGINDAPVLSTASVGVAMGGIGSDIAIESADVVIMTDEPRKLVEAIKISKNTKRIVAENVIFTIGLKVLTMVLVSFGLVGMWMAVFADVGVSVLAVLNSLRAMKRFGKRKNKTVDK